MDTLDDFKTVRRIRAINRFFQILFSLTLIVGLNYLAAKHYSRIDLTAGKQFSLSPETIAYLKALENPVDIFVTYTPEANEEFFNFVETLLTSYAIEGRGGGGSMINVEYVDLYKQRRRAQELISRYDIQSENTMVVASGDRRVEIDRAELFEVKDGEITGFKGEQVFTNAILEVSNPDKPKIYFTVGHGEKRLDNVDPLEGLSVLDDYLQEKNFELATLDLSQVPTVPDDAQLVVVAGAQAAFLSQEVEKLRTFLSDQNGRLLILMDPFIEHGMEDLFYEWGVLVEDMMIVDRAPNAVSTGGDLIVRRFAEHPATQFLIDFQLFVLMGNSRPIRADPGAPFDERLVRTPLVASSQLSWAERNYKRGRQQHEYDPQVDIQGPVHLGIAAERRIGESMGIELPGGRLVAFGSSDFISNRKMEAYGNRTLILNTIRWMLDRESSLNIKARDVESYRLVISEAELQKLLLYLFTIPGGTAIFGMIILFIRKR